MIPEYMDKLVLLVNQHPLTAAVYSEHLQRYGYGVAESRTGREALALARTRLPDLVITHYPTQGESGELTRELRRLPGGERLPILNLTARVYFPEDRQEALAAGIDRNISVPVDLDELLAEIRALIG